MSGLTDWSEFVEIDPTGRYGRYNEVLGKGASKTVYRAFDEFEGIEVAWNQVKLYDFLQSPEDLERLYCEIHLLKTLKHDNIMKFYSSWVDVASRNINFVTEMFTSGTLRQYRLKHKRVNIRAVKHWCRQILKGLNYLHSHDPPVIHRDLKCDNIFVNGHQGEVKIGDLGLAAILKKSHADHCVGTPEFMAPEVYQEEYNELVDIYSFGMCILEMVTFEYPYSECTHPAQIYRKVISGKKPDALYKVKDPEVRQFVDKCLASVSMRLSARELLNDPFLRNDDCGGEPDFIGTLLRQPYLEYHNEYSNGFTFDAHNEWGYYHPVEVETTGIELFEQHDDDHSAEIDISITGKTSEDGGIFLKLRIADEEGRVRNIYFPFDVETDTALSVATEMVAELDIIVQDVNKIAETIDGEVALLVPEWSPRIEMEETEGMCQCCASNGSFTGLLSNKPGAKNLECLSKGCASLHGRFEEITYQAEESEHRVTESAGNDSSQLSDDQSFHSTRTSCCDISSSHENEIQQGLRWLKAKYRMELRDVRDNQLGLVSKAIDRVNKELETGCGVLSSLLQNPLGGIGNDNKHFDSNEIVTAKSFYCGSLLPRCLNRTTSLPVDAVYIHGERKKASVVGARYLGPPVIGSSAVLQLTSFDPNNIDVQVEGDASVSDRLIQLTSNRGDKSKAESVGRAVYPQSLPLWNEDSGEVTDFATHFSFVVNAQNVSPYGDGFTFFLAHEDLPLPVARGGGRGLGLLSTEQVLNSTTSPSAYPFVAVEFDTFANIVIDPDYEHVGIDIKSMNSSAYVKWCSNAMKGQENEAWVAYDSSSKNLSVSFYGFCNNTKVRQLVSYRVDLSTILPTFVMFGFSGATGNYSEIHTVKSWSFSSTLTPGHAPEGEKIGRGLKVGFIAVGFACVLIAVLGLVWCVLIKKRKKEEDAFDLVMDDEFERGTEPKRFLYDKLARATSDFAEGEKLGEGGFGGVYKGYLKDLESYIAVKRVSKGSNQGVKEYASEVRIISCLRHKNLVQLIGWCHEKRGLLLVYEFMPNGSLDHHLFKEKSELSWIQRGKIVQGLASALYYLHEEWEQCVVHRDIKSSNIMLDASFTAKLGDFGLARLVDHAKGSQTTILAGTLGYMAPECYVTGKASKESDVYSFGVVALEIACGRRPFNPNAEERERVLVHWVWELHGSGNILEAADPSLCGNFDEEQMKQLLMVGIWCTHPDNGFRPSIRQAIQALNGEVLLPVLPSKMPVPTYSSILEPLPDQSSGRHIFSTMVPR